MAHEADLNHIKTLQVRASALLDLVGQQLDFDSKPKSLDIRFNVKQAAQLVGRTESTIRRAEDLGELPSPRRRDSGVREGYSLAEINIMRDHFCTRPFRQAHEEPAIIAFQNFKGGVGKSTNAVHAAQYFALQGYRTLLVDVDPQASATLLFGLNPSRDISEEATALPFLLHETDSLGYAVRNTYWEGLDLIPSCLTLYEAEYSIAAGADDPKNRFEALRWGIDSVKRKYDVIVIDPPPALGMISLNALRAANALVVPTPPAIVDYGSTVMFLTMLVEALSILERNGFSATYHFVKVLATRVDENKRAQKIVREGMKKVFGTDIYSTALIDSSEYNTAAAELRSVYEYSGAATQTYKRCRANLDRVMEEIEESVRLIWPSHQRAMRRLGAA